MAYTAKDITAFKRDLDKIRAKPSMYIGPTDGDGIFTGLRECADNAIDEARAGRNKSLSIWIEKDTITVADQGVGIPVEKHPTMKISTLTHVLTNLQSSGKMKTGAYEHSIGVHGVGIKATNALSAEFQCWTFRKDQGGWHTTSFAKGREKSAVAKCRAPKLPDGTAAKLGTVVRFVPDMTIFTGKIDPKRVAQYAQMAAFMNAGLEVKLTVNGKTKTYLSKRGIADYLDKQMVKIGATALSEKPLVYQHGSIELAMHFSDAEGDNIEFYTNTVRNMDRGFHADALFKALVDALAPYKLAKQKFTPTDLREGLVGILNFRIVAPQYSSQTKDKLVDQRAKTVCYQDSLEAFAAYFKKNKALAKKLCERAALLRSKTQDFLKDKKLISKVKAAAKNIHTKLVGVVGKKPASECELFIIEGDSAGGGLVRARDRTTQAVYPLKGKPLNVTETDAAKVNSNPEMINLLAALGIGLSSGKTQAIRYGKIISMADPDIDGLHINCLVMGALWKYAPHLFKQGCIYVVKAPLYKCRYKDKLYFGMTKKDIEAQTKQPASKLHITYIKGWGEINEDELYIAIDPKHRMLYQVQPPDREGARTFGLLMGKSPAYRKQLFGVQ